MAHVDRGDSSFRTWFVVKGEPIEIRMVSSELSDAHQAARELGAKMFFRWENYCVETRHHRWIVYRVGSNEPLKRIASESVDAPVMFCIAMESVV